MGSSSTMSTISSYTFSSRWFYTTATSSWTTRRRELFEPSPRKESLRSGSAPAARGGSPHPAERFTRREVDRASETRKKLRFLLAYELRKQCIVPLHPSSRVSVPTASLSPTEPVPHCVSVPHDTRPPLCPVGTLGLSVHRRTAKQVARCRDARLVSSRRASVVEPT